MLVMEITYLGFLLQFPDFSKVSCKFHYPFIIFHSCAFQVIWMSCTKEKQVKMAKTPASAPGSEQTSKIWLGVEVLGRSSIPCSSLFPINFLSHHLLTTLPCQCNSIFSQMHRHGNTSSIGPICFHLHQG